MSARNTGSGREIVVADIGGTHARFALVTIAADGAVSLGEPVKLQTADHASLQTAWEALGRMLGRTLPREAAIAIAAPIQGEVVRMTNSPWTLHPGRLADQLDLDAHILINDFAAVAHAVDCAAPDDLVHLTGPDIPLPDRGAISIVGPGTGLGIALLLRTGDHSHVVETEGGHVDFAPLDRVEDRLLAHLREHHTRVSAERIVSGPGLRAIYQVLAELEDREMPRGDDKALWSMALEGTDSLAAAALERFCLCLGAVAGDVALTHGPGPVVIAGGLGYRLRDVLPRSGFAERFAAKGRYAALMRNQSVKLVTHPQPGLFGAAHAFAKRSAD